jgi:hypothetical protein
MSQREAIIDACSQAGPADRHDHRGHGRGHAAHRLGIGPGRVPPPMAIAVIGGLITSTVLSLLYIPVVFVLMDGLTVRASRLMRRIFGGVRCGGRFHN